MFGRFSRLFSMLLKSPKCMSTIEGENLPDRKFFENALQDKFKVPADKTTDFITIFEQSLDAAKLIQNVDDRIRLIDVTEAVPGQSEDQRLKKIGKDVRVASGDTCFVMMPFANPIGSYYEKIYEPAIKKAGLTARPG
jgi:hypothetical protein